MQENRKYLLLLMVMATSKDRKFFIKIASLVEIARPSQCVHMSLKQFPDILAKVADGLLR
jgi:hypothetical protein